MALITSGCVPFQDNSPRRAKGKLAEFGQTTRRAPCSPPKDWQNQSKRLLQEAYAKDVSLYGHDQVDEPAMLRWPQGYAYAKDRTALDRTRQIETAEWALRPGSRERTWARGGVDQPLGSAGLSSVVDIRDSKPFRAMLNVSQSLSKQSEFDRLASLPVSPQPKEKKDYKPQYAAELNALKAPVNVVIGAGHQPSRRASGRPTEEHRLPPARRVSSRHPILNRSAQSRWKSGPLGAHRAGGGGAGVVSP